MKRRRSPVWLILALAVCAAPQTALAHSPIPGVGYFYSGMLHPLRVVEHLLALSALSLLWGQHGFDKSFNAILALLVGMAAGLLGLVFGPLWEADSAQSVLLSLTLVAALGVATLRLRSARHLQLLTFLIAFLVMADSSQEGVPQGKFAIATAGVACTMVLYVVDLGLLVQWGKAEWARIGTRVAGSWIAAASLMVLALQIHKRQFF